MVDMAHRLLVVDGNESLVRRQDSLAGRRDVGREVPTPYVSGSANYMVSGKKRLSRSATKTCNRHSEHDGLFKTARSVMWSHGSMSNLRKTLPRLATPVFSTPSGSAEIATGTLRFNMRCDSERSGATGGRLRL